MDNSSPNDIAIAITVVGAIIGICALLVAVVYGNANSKIAAAAVTSSAAAVANSTETNRQAASRDAFNILVTQLDQLREIVKDQDIKIQASNIQLTETKNSLHDCEVAREESKKIQIQTEAKLLASESELTSLRDRMAALEKLVNK